jgi:hypothetical protein
MIQAIVPELLHNPQHLPALSDFWKRPVFQYWQTMLERGRQFAYAGVTNPASSEVIATNVLPRMMHRVLVEHWEEAHKKAAQIYARQQEER